MSPAEPDTWPGCHGVRLVGPVRTGLGRTRGEPLVEAGLEVAEVEPEPGEEVWAQPVGPSGGTQRLLRHRSGELTVEVGAGRRLRISQEQRRLTVTAPFDGIQAQLCASFGFPLLLADQPVVVLHGAAFARAGRCVVVVGPGGAGKSGALIASVDAGWSPLSEDVCVVDLRTPDPLVWPGPPWVRAKKGEAGPAGAAVAFETSEKTGFDLGPWMATEPQPLARLVVLLPPGGSQLERVPLSRAEALAALAPHAVFLPEPLSRGARLFGPVATLATRVPVSHLRLPIRPDWAACVVGSLDQLTARS